MELLRATQEKKMEALILQVAVRYTTFRVCASSRHGQAGNSQFAVKHKGPPLQGNLPLPPCQGMPLISHSLAKMGWKSSDSVLTTVVTIDPTFGVPAWTGFYTP